MLRHWRALLAFALVGGWVALAVWLSDLQGRMDLPRAYSVRMTCEDDPEAALWHGGCERIAPDIAKSGRPPFGELYAAFVTVHHKASPREEHAARFSAVPAEDDFDLGAYLSGQRYGLASVTPEFVGVARRDHAEAVKASVDTRDRALMVIGRAGLGFDALAAGALANLAHPGAMVDGAVQLIQIWLGIAKSSDLGSR